MFTSKHFIQITKPAEIISLLIKREFKHIILKLMQLISIHLVYTYYVLLCSFPFEPVFKFRKNSNKYILKIVLGRINA